MFMKTIKKRGIRIEHNKNLLFIILFLLIILIIVIYFIVQNSEKGNECDVDTDCVPNGCCHPDSCVSVEMGLDCRAISIFCDASCSGPLDCGAGSCSCNKGICEVVSND